MYVTRYVCIPTTLRQQPSDLWSLGMGTHRIPLLGEVKYRHNGCWEASVGHLYGRGPLWDPTMFVRCQLQW